MWAKPNEFLTEQRIEARIASEKKLDPKKVSMSKQNQKRHKAFLNYQECKTLGQTRLGVAGRVAKLSKGGISGEKDNLMGSTMDQGEKF
jgi:hypothetical protein